MAKKIKLNAVDCEARKKRLRKLLDKAGRVVYASVKHVSRNGMCRSIDLNCFTVRSRKEQQQTATRGTMDKIRWHWLSHDAAAILGEPFDSERETVRVHGCGMNMCSALVYALGRALYPSGDGKTVTGRNGDTEPETDGGYLLRCESL